MNSFLPVSPRTCCCPTLVGDETDRGGVVDVADCDDELVDSRMAMLGEPIVGVERVVYDESTGSGSLPARPISEPYMTLHICPMMPVVRYVLHRADRIITTDRLKLLRRKFH